MKTYHQLLTVPLCTACAVVVFNASLPAGAFARDVPTRTKAVAPSNIEGKVLAKSGNTLSVSGKTISISSTTIFIKSGKPATSADVEIGAMVKVTTKKAADGSLQAVSVEVL